MKHWSNEAFFYHIYPLGAFGAPRNNDFCSEPVCRLSAIHGTFDHLTHLGVNAIYMGPLFESGTHGYDTACFYTVDRRLGTNADLSNLVKELHQRGIRIILDGVFNHVGRNFPAFKHVCEHGHSSPYVDWFDGINFNNTSPYGDHFSYNGWNGHFDLVKLNLSNEKLLEHIFSAIEMWINEFDIDGLRLDVADCLPQHFMRRLSSFCKSRKSDFWLMGEVVHGDYRNWAGPGVLDSVTNYESYKGLYSSHVDKNYFEIAYALNRQFGKDGIYKDITIYNFVDNHDVSRIRDNLSLPAHLFPLHCLLFTMPGVPSIYYGSEWGIHGKKAPDGDWHLRPALDMENFSQDRLGQDLTRAIANFSSIRHTSTALKTGSYQELLVEHEQLAFLRESSDENIIVVINAANKNVPVRIQSPFLKNGRYEDLLNKHSIDIHQQTLDCNVPSCWARILRLS